MKRPDRPRVTGALAPHAKGFGIELSRQGYSPWTASEHIVGWITMASSRLSSTRCGSKLF